MNSDTAITVNGLSKAFRIGLEETRAETLAGSIANMVKAPLRNLRNLRGLDTSKGGEGKETLWALRDVSFEVKKGEVLGIIGRNGAGKSTLLKVLSRITEPTRGEIRMRGRVSSLLEVGTGFHPELTGRENIYMNGTILGMRKHEIARKFDEIVEFSGVERFLDTPVKRYSSGQKVRLAFSVAAHLEPEILIVDEVLAVGDMEFQKKCIGRMKEVAKGGERTVLFVSHNMAAVQQLCTRGIVIAGGRNVLDGSVDEVTSSYLQDISEGSQVDLPQRTDRKGRGTHRFNSITLEDGIGGVVPQGVTGRPVSILFRFSPAVVRPQVVFTIYNMHGIAIAFFDSMLASEDDHSFGGVAVSEIACSFEELLLVAGSYRLNAALLVDGVMEDHVEGAVCFDVVAGAVRGRRPGQSQNYGSVTLPHRWTLSCVGVPE